MTKEKIDQEELERYRLTLTIVFIGFVLFCGIIVVNLQADTITHKFKNPSFGKKPHPRFNFFGKSFINTLFSYINLRF